MCKFISNDSIIGNFVIAAVEKDCYKVEMQKLYDFDDLLSNKFEIYDYYSNFDLIRIMDFVESYPSFVESVDEQYFYISMHRKDKSRFLEILVRHFRFGIEEEVVKEMKSVLSNIL